MARNPRRWREVLLRLPPPFYELRQAGKVLATVQTDASGRWYWYGSGHNSLPATWRNADQAKEAVMTWLKNGAHAEPGSERQSDEKP